MKRRSSILFLILVMVIPLWQCKEKYVSPYVSPPSGYLVVEGYITGNGPTQFKLSRTVPLPGNGAVPVVQGAQVQVEGDDNSTYPLTEADSGTYGIDTLALNAAVKYRLRINTSDGKSYLSDFAPFKPTPAIDSISWMQNNLGVQIYANTHDPANATHYYQWTYDETWEYTSGEFSSYQFQQNPDTVVPRTVPIFYCWKSDASTTIILGNSSKLSQDLIFLQPLTLIAANTQPLGVLYSINVRQYALTEDGYNYLTLMQKNTESLGSIFDAQPSELVGNIHCLSNPAEQVIGFISAGTVREQRIFISRSQLSSWSYSFGCASKDTVVPPDDKNLEKFFLVGGYIPVDEHFNPNVFDGWSSNLSYCIDCRLQGGVTTKPSYWPY